MKGGREYDILPRTLKSRLLLALAILGGLSVMALVAAGLVLVASWSPHFERSDLVGVYVAKYPSGTETLTLKPDGTFLQEVRLKEPRHSTPVTRSGYWTWDESRQYLDLHDGMAVNDGSGEISPTFQTGVGGGSFPLDRKWWFFGQLYLGVRESAPLWKVD